MKISISKILALGGLCALLAGTAGAASAQGYGTPDIHHRFGAMHHARHHIMRLKTAYARDVASGHYRAAEKAHLEARAIRHHVRAHREMMHYKMHHDYGF